MSLTVPQMLMVIVSIASGAIITRFLPFVMFPEKKEVPKYITYLGKTLPPAMIGLLVVYSLKSISMIQKPYAVPELLAILTVIALHLWKGKLLVSIGIGTVLYMILIQFVFA